MRQELLINDGWLFQLGECEQLPIRGHFDSYMSSKAVCGKNEAASLFYDEEFQKVRLPHDYALAGKPSSDANSSSGFYERGNAWYRRHFNMPCDIANKRVLLYFEGAGQKTTVWVNGQFAVCNNSMYNSFYADITPYLLDGENVNTISVHIENPRIEGWWYEGAGIYRSVYLIITDKIAIDQWGIWVNPQKNEDKSWNVPVESTIYSICETKQHVTMVQTIVDAKDNVVAKKEIELCVKPETNVFTQTMEVKDPTLWDTKTPYLYSLVTEIYENENMLDRKITTFGFRTICFDGDSGFYLNGVHTSLNGGCVHQDHGNLGVAVPNSVFEFRVKNLKEAGFNSLRFAHHNPSPEWVSICDRQGIMVIDENRWFNWSNETKNELISLIKRDRNSPSVIIWSIGNEEPLQSTPLGAALVRNMKRLVKSYDDTRPVTIALNGGFYDPYAGRESDVLAINYFLEGYEKFPRYHPDKVVVATESAATGGSRGVYFKEDFKTGYDWSHSEIYDEQKAPFGSTNREAIIAAQSYPYVAGTYIWAAIEYRGESGWPGLFSTSGVLDNCGLKKDSFYLVKSLWCKETPMLHLLPHWSHDGKEGKLVKVQVYTNCDSAELFLNDVSLGMQTVENSQDTTWMVPYQKGCIRAVGYQDKVAVASDEHQTAGTPIKLCINLEDKQVNNTGEDTMIADAYFVDKQGIWVPTANQRIEFTCEGGQLLCVSGGDVYDHEDPKENNKKMFNGRVQAVFRVEEGATKLSIGATCGELALETSIECLVKNEKRITRLPICNQKLSVNTFRIWPIQESIDAVTIDYNFADMNTNQSIKLPQLLEGGISGASIFTASTIIPLCKHSLALMFVGLKGVGKIRIYHEKDCWPNPEPKEYIDNIISFEHCEKKNLAINLNRFGSNEKVKLIISICNEFEFALEDVVFTK